MKLFCEICLNTRYAFTPRRGVWGGGADCPELNVQVGVAIRDTSCALARRRGVNQPPRARCHLLPQGSSLSPEGNLFVAPWHARADPGRHCSPG